MALDELPRQFLSSVRVLFDVLDSKRQGFLKFSDIEMKWNKDNTDKLPSDVLACLRLTSSPSGYLSFEQFVAGLQMSMGKRENDNDVRPPKPARIAHPQHRSVSVSHVKELETLPHQLRAVSQEYIHHGQDTVTQKLEQTSLNPQTKDADQNFHISPRSSAFHKPESEQYKRQVPKRRESARRHTLGHGVDGSMVRRSKLLEEERRMLLRGLQAIDKAKHWYTKRLAEVSDKQRFGASETNDQTTDQQQEKINFEKLRISELIQQIDALTEPNAQGSLMRMNLARSSVERQQTIPYELSESDTNHALDLLRAQNKMLTKEVSQKCERIAQLEKDKATLLRDLFESRGNQRMQQRFSASSVPLSKQSDDSTFM